MAKKYTRRRPSLISETLLPRTYWRFEYESIEQVLREAFTNDVVLADDPYNFDVYIRHSQDKWMQQSGIIAGINDIEAFKYAMHNPKGYVLEAVKEMKEQITESMQLPTQNRRRTVKNLDNGTDLDVDKMYFQPEIAWSEVRKVSVPAKIITIGINMSARCGQEPDEVLWRGAAAVALADILTQRGISVQIVAICKSGNVANRDDTLVARLIVKRPDMPLSISTIASACCNIYFMRVGILCASVRKIKGKPSYGYGYPMELHGTELDGIDYLIKKDITNRESAKQWLREKVNRGQESQ